ncbi:MAG TPA: WecB/TagA/CpsF family glycosyltransferase [Kofleriaceae bacterium]|nr:WecB/TagA/CpsF family glycosyltransferase [Kofleriaceae bacterium]
MVEVLGVRIDPVTWIELRERVVHAIRERRPTTLMYANVHVLNTAHEQPALADALATADVVYCDGEGVRVAARLAGSSLPERMTGADFIWDLARELATIRAKAYWVGGAGDVGADALAILAERNPGLQVAGAHHGFFEKEGRESDAVIDAINASGADIVFVGMGTPAQELWVARNRERIAAPVVWSIGATADFVAGVQPRGPAFLTQHGFEWLARLWSDPRRLFGRYVIGNPLFVARVVRRRLARR